MSLDGRLNRLVPGLSARERALLVVRASYDDRNVDPAVTELMPSDQYAEFNRLMARARGVHRVLLPYSLVLHGEVEALELRHMVLAMSCAWGSERILFAGAAALVARIPIAQSEYDALVAEQRADYVGLNEALEMVILHRDLDESRSVERAVLRELREAVKATRLTSRRCGRVLQVEIGSLYDWLGDRFEAYPEWGRYEPVSDDGYKELRCRREGMERQVAQLESGPSAPWAVLPALREGRPHAAQELKPHDEAMLLIADQVTTGIRSRWGSLLALELVVSEVGEAFGDESAIPLHITTLLKDARRRLERLHQEAPALLGPSNCRGQTARSYSGYATEWSPCERITKAK